MYIGRVCWTYLGSSCVSLYGCLTWFDVILCGLGVAEEVCGILKLCNIWAYMGVSLMWFGVFLKWFWVKYDKI